MEQNLGWNLKGARQKNIGFHGGNYIGAVSDICFSIEHMPKISCFSSVKHYAKKSAAKQHLKYYFIFFLHSKHVFVSQNFVWSEKEQIISNTKKT